MKKLKKGAKIFLISILVLIGLAISLPYIFKGKIVSYVKTTINENVNGKVDFKGVSLSLFRNFPKVSIGLDELIITGTDSFTGDTLLFAKRFDVAVDLVSFIRGKDMVIHTVVVENPIIHAKINEAGLANWDIVKPDTTMGPSDVTEDKFILNINKYEIENAYISYIDVPGNMSAEIIGLDHSGSGNFQQELLTLTTTTKAKEVTYVYGGIPFLSKVVTAIVADVKIDNKQNSYTFSSENASLNDLKLAFEGVIKQEGESGYNMDIEANTPSTDLKNFLSLVPIVYKNDFASIKASGQASLNAKLKGIYNENSMPGYRIDLQVKDGYIQYPDLPKPLKNIALTATVDNPNGQTDNTVVNISKGHIDMDDMPLDFRLLVKQPVSNLYIDAAVKGKLDLSRINQILKLGNDTKLTGLLNADVLLVGLVSDIEKQRYDKFNAAGTILLSDFLYASKDQPDEVRIHSLNTSFAPNKVTVSKLSGNYLATNFNGFGEVNNLLVYLFKQQPLNAFLNVSADKLNLNDWLGISTDTTTANGPQSAPFVVPKNLDVTLQAAVQKLHYDKTDIDNLSGTLLVKDETVFLKNLIGNALDGSIAINGEYSTLQSPAKPAIALDYKVNKVDIQKTFYAFNTVQKLMPIGKFIAGKLSSQLSIRGNLGDNMMPEMNSLSGSGNLLLIEGFLSKFAPLDEIAKTLSIKALEGISLRDIKNNFEFTNGKILVNPFKLSVAGISMEIFGMQGIDQSLDYKIQMNVPRSMMGTKGNQLIDNLTSKVNNQGVPLKVGETVPLTLTLSGFMSAPTVKTDLKQGTSKMADEMKQQMTDFAKSKVDSTKKAVTNAARDTLNSVKGKVLENAKDALLKQVSGNKTSSSDTTTKTTGTKESVKGLMNNLLKKKQKDTENKQ